MEVNSLIIMEKTVKNNKPLDDNDSIKPIITIPKDPMFLIPLFILIVMMKDKVNYLI